MSDRRNPDRHTQLKAAAERAAASAPEIRAGDDVALGLQRLYTDLPGWLAAPRATGEEPGHAA